MFNSRFQRFSDRQDADLAAVRVNHPNFPSSDLLVDVDAIRFLRPACFSF
jgi:hypothetical protein